MSFRGQGFWEFGFGAFLRHVGSEAHGISGRRLEVYGCCIKGLEWFRVRVLGFGLASSFAKAV